MAWDQDSRAKHHRRYQVRPPVHGHSSFEISLGPVIALLCNERWPPHYTKTMPAHLARWVRSTGPHSLVSMRFPSLQCVGVDCHSMRYLGLLLKQEVRLESTPKEASGPDRDTSTGGRLYKADPGMD